MHPATILVIDDDRAIADTFIRMLSLEGHDVRSALDAESGLRQLDVLMPDAIMLDLRMPRVDGLEFLRRLRAQPIHRETPVAIVTGDYMIDDALQEELQRLGAAIHFKPVWCDDLLRIADSLVRGSPERQFPQTAAPAVSSRDQPRRTLLLVDDCIPQRDLYEFALQKHFNVLTASRGDEGVRIASRDHPDVIVLDVMMPGLDGWQTCRSLKSNADTADIPVIFLTSRDDEDLSARATSAGGSGVLRKPCPADELVDQVCSTLLGRGEL